MSHHELLNGHCQLDKSPMGITQWTCRFWEIVNIRWNYFNSFQMEVASHYQTRRHFWTSKTRPMITEGAHRTHQILKTLLDNHSNWKNLIRRMMFTILGHGRTVIFSGSWKRLTSRKKSDIQKAKPVISVKKVYLARLVEIMKITRTATWRESERLN